MRSVSSLASGGLERKLLYSTRLGHHNGAQCPRYRYIHKLTDLPGNSVHPKHITKPLARQKSTSSDSDPGPTPSEPKSRTSRLADYKTRSKSSPYPRLEQPIHLRGRIDGLVKIVPDNAYIPIVTSLPPLIFPDGTPISRPTTLRPPYLTEELATHLNMYVNDPYMITRSIELFGSPWSSGWVANLKVGMSKWMIMERTTSFLSALAWNHGLVKPLTDAAWAEHLVAMQSPRLRYGPDNVEARNEEQTTNPLWPSDTPDPQNLGLSWSSSSERDTPRTVRRYPPLGKQMYPRPKRIDRFYPWDHHLIIVFASPAARRAVMAAYVWWVRHKLVDAHRHNDEPGQPVVLPPVGLEELGLGEIPVGMAEKEAMNWASEVGWRPEYRIRPYRGRRKKNDDGGGWYETEVRTRLRVRDRKRELERGQLEGAQRRGTRGKGSEDDLDSEGSDLAGKQ